MEVYVLIYLDGKTEVLSNKSPQETLDYIAERVDQIEVIEKAKLIDFPKELSRR